MVNDTVREELETKIARVSGPLRERAAAAEAKAAEAKPEPPPAAQPKPVTMPSPPRSYTSQLPPKKTSPTLVDFQPKNQTLPDWRLQLQNAVRQRAGGAARESAPADAIAQPAQRTVTQGATALKAESVQPPPAAHANDKVAAALRRIEESRRTFLPSEKTAAAPAAAAKPAPARQYPFNVVSRSAETPAAPAPAPAVPQQAAKPKLVSSLRIEKKAYDTNKLPPIPQPAKLSSSFASAPAVSDIELPEELIDERLEADAVHTTNAVVEPETFEQEEAEMIDDLPTVSVRFGSGLFDFILSAAATLVILSPFMVGGGTWISASGILAFGATLSIFLFLYLTASLAVWGKTFGMRIFSIELIDIEENSYPTIHQAAVNSAVYILSMAFAGAGFLTMWFNEERRAVHDIISGTLLVREI